MRGVRHAITSDRLGEGPEPLYDITGTIRAVDTGDDEEHSLADEAEYRYPLDGEGEAKRRSAPQ